MATKELLVALSDTRWLCRRKISLLQDHVALFSIPDRVKGNYLNQWIFKINLSKIPNIHAQKCT